jgi:Sec-independent protein translocase protein TatA
VAMPSNLFVLAFWSPSPSEMLLVAVVALLLYGGDLPKVARSWAKSFAEIRRGLAGFQSDINQAMYSEPDRLEYHRDVDYRDDAYVPDNLDQAGVAIDHATDSADQSEAGEHPASDKPKQPDDAAERSNA